MNFTRLSRVVAISIGTLAVSGAVLAASLPRGIGTQEQDKTGVVADKRPVVGPNSIGVGAYDPHGDFSSDPNVKFEHLFLPWEDVDLSSLAKADDYALQRGRSLIITVEPWSWSVDWRVSPETLVQGILAGKYDVNMAAICTAAADLKSPVIIRWAQEMDETDGQFSWAKWSPSEYIKAYERMVTECRRVQYDGQIHVVTKGQQIVAELLSGRRIRRLCRAFCIRPPAV